MPIDFSRFDGSGREPRAQQIQALEYLSKHWDDDKHFVLCLDTGSGKQALARAVQLATNGAIVVPTNELMNQAKRDYADLSGLKGAAHYKCSSSELGTSQTCSDKVKKLKHKPCVGCPFWEAKHNAKMAKATIFNVFSYWYAKKTQEEEYKVLIIDEAHAVLEQIKSFCGQNFKIAPHERELDFENTFVLLTWLDDRIDKEPKDSKKREAIEFLRKCIMDTPEIFSAKARSKFLEIRPVLIPYGIIKKFFGDTKLIMMSATFTPDVRKSLTMGEPHHYLELPSPIPVENRTVMMQGPGICMKEITPKETAEEIEKVLARYPGLNTLVHMTYKASKEIEPFMRTKVITHNSGDDKAVKLAEFKEKGGVLFGSGMMEGIDLPGDLCRLVIVPRMHLPNMGDHMIKKRTNLRDGWMWYRSKAMVDFRQQIGRGVRGADDWAKIVVLDSRFSSYVNYTWRVQPKYFLEAIDWEHKWKKQFIGKK